MPFDGSTYQVTTSPVTRMLVEGRQQLESGWCQNVMRQRGTVCMIGSLPIEDHAVFAETQGRLLAAICDLGYPHSSVPDFNDDSQRTQQQVLEVYDRAILQAMV